MILVRNSYYATPGNESAVWATRLEASQQAIRLGLPAGQILLPIVFSGDAPTVVWECVHSSMEDRKRISKLLSENIDFAAVRERMSTLTRRIERQNFELVE